MEQLLERLNSLASSRAGSVTFIAIAGGSGSGKSTIGELLRERLGPYAVSLIALDLFYREVTPEIRAAYNGAVNFDDPGMFDLDAVLAAFACLSRREPLTIPLYDYAHDAHSSEFLTVPPADIVVLEGIYAFYWPEIARLCSLKVFVECSGETRLIRRIRRDVQSRGRNVEQVLSSYERFVYPAYDKYVCYQRRLANIVIPWEGSNEASNVQAVETIANHISCIVRYVAQ